MMRALVVRTVACHVRYRSSRTGDFAELYTLGNIEICSGKAVSGQQRRVHINTVLAILLMIDSMIICVGG